MKDLINSPWRLLTVVFGLQCCLLALSGKAYADSRLAPPLTEQATMKSTEHSAEVLWSITQSDVQEDGHWQNTYYYSIRLNDLEAARDYGRIAIAFNHYYSDLTIDFANVLAKDSSMSSVAKDAIQLRVTGGGQDFYSDSSEYVFSLPDIQPGSIIEFQYTRKSKTLALPGLTTERLSPFWFQQTVGGDAWRMDYVHNHRFDFTHPKNKKFYQKSYHSYPSKAKKSRNGDLLTKTWKMKNIAPVTSEAWMPNFREIAPQISLSTHKDWSFVDAWAWNNFADKIKPTEELRAVAASFNLDADASVDEKVRKVYEYLQDNVRYVFAHLGRGGYEPHFANEVIESSYGDCKDQSVLAVALLRILGVNALPALVETPRSGKHDTALVKMIFDHMIVYIPKGPQNEAMWLDTTGDRTLFPGMSNYLYKQNALIVDGTGGTLTKIEKGLENNTARLELDFSAKENGQIIVHATLLATGLFEQNLRAWWLHDKDREASLEKRMQSFFNESKDFEVKSRIKNVDNLWSPIILEADYEFAPPKDPATPTAYAANFAQIYNQFGQLTELQSPDTRIHPYVDQYAYQIELVANFAAQSDINPIVAQSSGNISNRYVQFTQKSHYVDEGIQVTAKMTIPPQELNVKAYKTYYQSLDKISHSDSWVVVLQDDEKAEAKRALAELKQDKGEKSSSYILALARNQIESGLFEEALTNAEKAVALDTDNGEAWYFLGMAQGFNSLIDESSNSFEKAESLGYLP